MKDQIVKIIAEYLEENTVSVKDATIWHLQFKEEIDKMFLSKIAAEIAENLLPIVGEKDLPYDKLFDHMSNEHGLTLIQGELGDIIHIARGGEQKTGWDDAPEWAMWKLEYSDGERAFSKGYPTYITMEVLKVERRPK